MVYLYPQEWCHSTSGECLPLKGNQQRFRTPTKVNQQRFFTPTSNIWYSIIARVWTYNILYHLKLITSVLIWFIDSDWRLHSLGVLTILIWVMLLFLFLTLYICFSFVIEVKTIIITLSDTLLLKDSYSEKTLLLPLIWIHVISNECSY